MKKLLVIVTILIMVLTIGLVACKDNANPTPQGGTKTQLSTPQDLKVSVNALISWKAVSGATSYELTINGEKYTVNTTSYQADKMLDFTVSVVAKADGYYDSEASTAKFESIWKQDKPVVEEPENVVLGIEGKSHINSKETLQLKANVSGTANKKVKWEVVEGSEFVSVDENGLLTAVEVSGDKFVRVKCTSDANESVSATKLLVLRARTELTQEMLDFIASKNVISYVGFLNINLYNVGSTKLQRTLTYSVETAMDGENWYAEYETSGIEQRLYYKNNAGYANQVGLSLMNDELYSPMLDENNNKVMWADAGLYNNFVGLKASDFTFDETEWRWVYSGKDLDLKNKILASSNPYDFEPINFSLMIENGEIVGIYAKAKDDYSLVANYNAIQELFVGIAYGKNVSVPTISKYTTEDIHEELNEAIQNMRSLNSYKVTTREIIASVYTSGYTRSGYYEYVTENGCHFEPFTFSINGRQEEIISPKANESYGYKKLGENFYNSYFENSDGTFAPSRAYENSFDEAKPSFAFAAEIFRTYFKDSENGTTTYYVDDLMNSVATTYYKGLGNDVALYGIFATRGYVSSTESFTPYVTVKDGYIVDSGFYFNLGSMSGIIEITYSDFNKTEIPDDKNITFETRTVPVSWSELTVIVNDSDGEDEEVNALDYFKEFYGNDNIDEELPFFGDALGDTFGFAMTSYYQSKDGKTKKIVSLYYDVPLDLDYTISTSMDAVKEFLVNLGYVCNAYGEYVNGNISVLLVDKDLDFFIYVWKN